MSKLEEMLKYVSEHNEFYKNRIKEYGITNPLDINQWPILTRKELQDNIHNLFSDGYKAKYLCHQLIRSASSGTSGRPISVYWDQADYHKSLIPLWRKRKKWYGILPSDKCVTFTLGHDNKTKKYHNVSLLESECRLLINASSLVSEDAYKAAIRRMLDFKPKWIYIQPFILEQLIYYYKKSNFKYLDTLVHIDSVGEVLTNQLRNDAYNFFGVPIANLYGSEEQNGIAYECPHGIMHIMEDNVYAEETGLITNLNNHAFPLIRYNQGDRIELIRSIQTCECGELSPYIRSIDGRIGQSIKVMGVEINSYLLSEIINIVNNQFNGMISKYSFCYSSNESLLICYISVRPENVGWNKSIICETHKVLKERLPVNEYLNIKVTNYNEEFVTNKTQVLTTHI